MASLYQVLHKHRVRDRPNPKEFRTKYIKEYRYQHLNAEMPYF